MIFFNGSWKTTSAGIIIVGTVMIHISFAIWNKTVTEQMLLTELPVLVGGIGLFFARDDNKTSKSVGAE
jgi:hypothetical protein